MVQIGLKCKHCDELLAEEVDESGSFEREFHDCFGEQPSYLGSVETDKVLTSDKVYIEILD